MTPPKTPMEEVLEKEMHEREQFIIDGLKNLGLKKKPEEIAEIISNDKWWIQSAFKLEGYNLKKKEAEDDFKENLLFTKSNHQLGCMLECYAEIISNRIGFEKETKQLIEIASKLK